LVLPLQWWKFSTFSEGLPTGLCTLSFTFLAMAQSSLASASGDQSALRRDHDRVQEADLLNGLGQRPEITQIRAESASHLDALERPLGHGGFPWVGAAVGPGLQRQPPINGCGKPSGSAFCLQDAGQVGSVAAGAFFPTGGARKWSAAHF
jgi:hypothetical protein